MTENNNKEEKFTGSAGCWAGAFTIIVLVFSFLLFIYFSMIMEQNQAMLEVILWNIHNNRRFMSSILHDLCW